VLASETSGLENLRADFPTERVAQGHLGEHPLGPGKEDPGDPRSRCVGLPHPFPDTLRDMEFTVVHELIHLEFATMERTEASRRDEEHAVNHVADALLDLDRSPDQAVR
jgi:hypothetical protein